MDLLRRGVSTQRRWTRDGRLHLDPAASADLAPEVAQLISTESLLDRALAELIKAGAVSPDSDDNRLVTVDATIGNGLIAGATAPVPEVDLATVWERQVLIVACRAVPFKYLEPAV